MGPPGVYLTPEGVPALRAYRYVGADHSLLYKYAASPFAEWVVATLIPQWAAPNLITLVGLLFQVAAFTAMMWHCPTMSETPPAWTVALAAVALFVYATLDNCDGKQARRTGSSSPLGLLMDHGMDCINSGFFGSVIMMMAVGAGASGWRHLVPWYLATLPFYFTTWEEYWVGEFNLPLLNGPNEGLALLTGSYVLTAALGPDFWARPVAGSAPLVAALLGPVHGAMLWVAGEGGAGGPMSHLDALFCFCLATVVATNGMNIVTVGARVLRDGRGPAALAAAYGQLLPFLAVVGASGAWLHVPPTKAAVAAHPFAFYAALGAALADMTAKLMLAHVTHQPYRPRTSGIALLVGTPLLWAAHARGLLPAGVSERLPAPDALLWLCVVVNVSSMAHFALVAPREIADALDIDIFDISKQVARAERTRREAAARSSQEAAAALHVPKRGMRSRGPSWQGRS